MHSLRNDAMPYVTQGCSFKCMYKPLVQHRICTPNHLKTVKFVKSVTISQQRLSNKNVPIEKPTAFLKVTGKLHLTFKTGELGPEFIPFKPTKTRFYKCKFG